MLKGHGGHSVEPVVFEYVPTVRNARLTLLSPGKIAKENCERINPL